MIATRHLKLMQAAAESLDLSAKLAENSYGHPNFTKISLSAPGSNENVRLHVWKEDDSNFHTHRWDMKSTIISGSYTTELFEEVDAADATPVNKFYCSDGIKGIYDISPMGRASIRLLRQITLTPGGSYSMAAGEIHRVSQIEQVVSLVECGPALFDHSIIYSQKPEPDNEPDSTVLTAEEVQIAIRNAVEAISKNAPVA
jgi:hypothetical protein